MTTSAIDQEYVATHPNSARLYTRAQAAIPSGLTHDGRALTPFPIYIDHAQGSRKWDVDGHEYVDYAGGHGALLLGHAHPSLVRAVDEQVRKGTHYGSGHELEMRWAEMVERLVPSAEQVRFTSSGTEATLLALRLARAFTGRDKVLKFEGHFHGWHDAVTVAVHPPYDAPMSRGIPAAVREQTVVVPPDDVTLVERTLDSDPDIGAVIIEPSGASWGTVPLAPLFLEDLREITERRGVLLIFDEIITAFRWAPGGIQELRSVLPDITTLGKILAGGLPGGAVAGRADVMERMTFKGDTDWDRFERTFHPGTFNANPLSAAAGVAMLEQAADGTVQKKAAATARALRLGMNEVAARGGCEACVYGDSSVFHIVLGPCELRDECDRVLCIRDSVALRSVNPRVAGAFRRAFLNNGVDLLRTGGFVSAVHDDRDVQQTLDAFQTTLHQMRAEGLL